jgi:hypothetical protein
MNREMRFSDDNHTTDSIGIEMMKTTLNDGGSTRNSGFAHELFNQGIVIQHVGGAIKEFSKQVAS